MKVDLYSVESRSPPARIILVAKNSMQDLQKEIEQLKARNRRVEADKARETSWARKIIIAILTYIVIVIFFYTAKISYPRINAIVPTIGFLLSTLSLGAFKTLRIKYRK